MTGRRYSSAVRAEQTRATRQRVIAAAQALFLRRGYTGATVEAIAARAGCSVQTVYNTVGGKAAVLKAVYDTMLAGDIEPVAMLERPAALAMRAAPDPRELLARYARMGRDITERVLPLLPILLSEGAAGDRDVKALIDTTEAERAIGTATVAATLQERFGLRVSVEEAADVLWTLTAPEVVLRLVHRRGWTLDRFERWLAEAMADAVLPR
ncbi:TetR/AcrR family transcriptional regulator [Dactylosporangium sp. NBC_01737]|uniref:TetR/AcrR family transcriptional regulator n=1 Tax=Dactylosporangium sp. NBC_01737 TaxID=2975959 RepID=UPI002E157CE2|nr:TetR/AcrR family transcriptional regulator [Dactylosporangium sp. NBC_01737]